MEAARKAGFGGSLWSPIAQGRLVAQGVRRWRKEASEWDLGEPDEIIYFLIHMSIGPLLFYDLFLKQTRGRALIDLDSSFPKQTVPS